MTHLFKPGPEGPGLFSFVTLGCKSNQYDSAAMAGQLKRAGMSEGPVESSSVVVVNTCMVTGPTESQCRKAIRQARRANPGTWLVVAGCMSKGARDQLESMEEVDLVIEPMEKGRLPVLLGLETDHEWFDWPDDPAVDPGIRDRGFLKVQDGCDAECTYCIVPMVRGRSRSLTPEAVLDAIHRLMDRGLSEVVLSGIHLGQYGLDQHPVCGLEELLEKFLHEEMPGRLRLSSIEPLEITPRLIEILALARSRICKHIHIPVQSGSDRILGAMGRPYNREQLVEAVRVLAGSVPGIGIGFDVICGFPGESLDDFKLTADLIEEYEIPYIHAFPYSPRPGTPAALMTDDIPHGVKKERISTLRSLAQDNRERFAASLKGSDTQVVLESKKGSSGEIFGLADNYLRVAVRGCAFASTPGSITRVAIEGNEGDMLLGYFKEDP